MYTHSAYLSLSIYVCICIYIYIYMYTHITMMIIISRIISSSMFTITISIIIN